MYKVRVTVNDPPSPPLVMVSKKTFESKAAAERQANHDRVKAMDDDKGQGNASTTVQVIKVNDFGPGLGIPDQVIDRNLERQAKSFMNFKM